MSWNYRVVNRKCEQTKEEFLGIYEVYYNPDGTPRAVTIDPVTFISSDLEEMKDIISKVKEATEKPVLDYDKLVHSS